MFGSVRFAGWSTSSTSWFLIPQQVSHSVIQSVRQSAIQPASQSVNTTHSAPYALNSLSIAPTNVPAVECLASVEWCKQRLHFAPDSPFFTPHKLKTSMKFKTRNVNKRQSLFLFFLSLAVCLSVYRQAVWHSRPHELRDRNVLCHQRTVLEEHESWQEIKVPP